MLAVEGSRGQKRRTVCLASREKKNGPAPESSASPMRDLAERPDLDFLAHSKLDDFCGRFAVDETLGVAENSTLASLKVFNSSFEQRTLP